LACELYTRDVPKKKTPAQIEREIEKAIGLAELQQLVDKWKSAATFSHTQAQNDPSDAEYRHGYAAASENAARDLSAIIQRKAGS